MRLPHFLQGREKITFLIALAVLSLCTGIIVLQKFMSAYAGNSSTELYVLASAPESPSAQNQAETFMRTLKAVYPDRIGPLEFRSGDWAFLIGERWFYYAEGRILPEERRNQAAEYRALGFTFNYPAELPTWESTAEQREERTRRFEESRSQRTEGPRTETRQPQAVRLRRPLYFAEALWGITNRNEAWAQQVEINFLGHSITIHSGISDIMKRIHDIIMNESRTNPAVRQWINSLGTVAGWNWRNVASSGNRSAHAYGIAIDILPRNLEGKATYWLWSSRYDPQWWNIPYSARYHPPNEVIRTFESFGFIWGGKWGNFDTMHFEYRPEVFMLNNLPLVSVRAELP